MFDARIKRGTIGLICLALFATTLATSCSSSRSRSTSADTETGATLGGSLGSNKDTTNHNNVGDYMKAQAQLLSAIDAMSTKQQGNDIKLTFDSATLFDFESAMLKQQARDDMQRTAEILVEYPHTFVQIAGHTSNEGDEAYNLKLSERQAMSVRNYLQELGVKDSRLETIGYGALRPIAGNDSDEGRRKNQRVEVIIRADAATIRAKGGSQ